MTRVLVVHDELSIRETFQAFLEEEGYAVSTAADFFEAESLLTQEPWDVVVVDALLPGANGLPLLQKARQINPDVPVIMITGEPDISTAAEAMHHGAYDYVAKPVTQAVLSRVVSRAAERKRLLDEKRRLEAQNRAYQAELEEVVARRTTELEQRNRELATLIDVGRDISATMDLTEVLRRVTQRTAQVCGAHRCTILLWESDEEALIPIMSQFSDGRPDPELWRLFKEMGYPSPVGQAPEAQQILREQRPLFIPDAPHSSLPQSLIRTFDVKSVLLVPLVSKEQIVGLMALDHVEEGREITPTQMDMAMAIGTQAAVAIENAQLFQKERKRAAQLAVVNQVARQIVSILDPDRILQEIVTAIRQGFDYYSVLLFLVDETGGDLKLLAAAGGFEDVLNSDYRQAVEVGMIGRAAKTGQLLLANDVSRNPHYIPAPIQEKISTQSELCVPLKLADRVIGVLDVQEARLNAFDETDVVALTTLADQISVALENARLYNAAQQEIAERERAQEALRERAARLELVARVGRKTTAILEPDELLHQAVDLIGEAFGYYNVAVLLVEGDAVVPRAVSLPQAKHLEGKLRLTIGSEGITGWVAQHGEPLLVPDVRADERHYDALEGDRTRAELAVPITLKGTIIGVLDVQSTEIDAFSQLDVFTMQAIADQLAVAIENARLYEEARRHVEELTALHNIDVAITSTLDPRGVLEAIYEQVREVMNLNCFYIGLCEEGGDRIYLPIVVEKGKRLPPMSLPGEGLTTWVIRTRQPLWIEDMEEEQAALPVEAIPLGTPTRSLMVLPLVTRDKIVGVISAQSYEPHAFDDGHRRLFTGIAHQVAIAVENARLFEEVNR
ncbi:MAG: hypothetical protein DRI48_04570, partial [Chloroflexi bacterium]